MAKLRQRLTYANVMSSIAVVLAIGGGTAYAATTINGHNIKNHTITGKKLVNNTLTGKQIKESALGQVPSAKHAQTAGTATTATTASTATSLHILPSGHSESGTWAGDGGLNGYWIGWETNFPLPLARPIPTDHVIWTGNGADSHCPGDGQAAPGYLCLYDLESSNVDWYGSRDDLLPQNAAAHGALGWFTVHTAGESDYAAFDWTVTAP